jgi:hypothetical protein
MITPQVLAYLYPGIDLGPDSADCFCVMLRGVGAITHWNAPKLGTQPTLTQLEAAWPAAQLASAKTQQSALLTALCDKAITDGFISSALGTANTYPSTLTDQHNLSGSVIASLIPNLPSTWTTKFWVMDSSGAWTFAAHTAAQIQQAGLDGKAWVTTQQEKLESLKAKVKAATTVTAVSDIVW